MVPLYHQVVDSLRRRIAAGEWAAGGRLPSVVDLAADYAIGEGTIRRAVNVLVDAGLVEVKKGRRPRLLRAPEEREAVLLPPGADVWVDAATLAEVREHGLPKGARMVRVRSRGVVRSWPAEWVSLKVAWNDNSHAG